MHTRIYRLLLLSETDDLTSGHWEKRDADSIEWMADERDERDLAICGARDPRGWL